MIVTRLALSLSLLCLALGASAADSSGAEAHARVQLAAAKAEGDLLSDAYLVPMIDLALEADDASRELDPALRSELERARDELEKRLALAENEVPVALHTTVKCLKKGADAEACDGSRARLAELAEDNGYHHYVLMSMAARRGDDEAFAAHGEKLLQAPVFEPDMIPIFASLYARYSEVPHVLLQHPGNEYGPEAAPGILAMAVAAAVVLPGYQPFVKACDEETEGRRALCTAVARRMAERSTVLLDRLVGVALLQKHGTPADKDAARKLEREVKWLHSNLARFDSELSDEQMGRYFDIFASEGELAAMRYAAQATGHSLVPPADWQP